MTFTLFDIKKKQNITIKSINFNLKLKKLNNEYKIIKLNDDFKKEMSNDDNYLPLFDIFTKKISLIYKSKIYKLIIYNSFRPLNNDLVYFFKKNDFNDLIKINKLFDFKILEELLLKFTFYDSKEIAADISNIKNPAYIDYLDINPYLKKSSIINTGLNSKKLKINQLPKEFYTITNEELNKIFLKIKNYLFTNNIILSNIKTIYDTNSSNLLNYYSFIGSFFINNFLRKNMFYDDNIFKQIKKLYSTISNIPKLEHDKLIFRFLREDDFLNIKKIGDIYINDSFMSCTRKPNINAQNNEFGFILLKIILTSKFKGYFISIENNSCFSNEKEIIIKPGVKFKLNFIDDDVEFYLFEKKYFRNIKKKYELEIVGINEFIIPSLEYKKIQIIDITKIYLTNNSLEDKINYFWNKYCKFNKTCFIKINDNIKQFYFNIYDSKDLYSKFYYYKQREGFFIYSFNKVGNLDCFIEVGNELIVNYASKYLNISYNDDIKIISALFCNLFSINLIKIFPYNYTIDKQLNKKNFLYNLIKFNEIIINIVFNKENEFDIFNYNKILEFLKKNIDCNTLHYNLISLFKKDTTYNDFIKLLYLKHPMYLKYLNKSLPDFILNAHYEFNPYEFLINNNYIYFMPESYSLFYSKNIEISEEIFDTETKDYFDRSLFL